MAEEPKPRAVRLSRERVLTGALELADAEGLDALSFRRLAAHLGVTPMALYRHVESKEALLDGLADLILGELELPGPQADDWRLQLRAVAQSFRAALVAHPGVVHILLSRPLFTPAAGRTADAMLGLLRGAGFPLEQAVLLYQQLARFLLALVLLETGGGRRLSESERREQARITRITLETLPSSRYPHLVEAAPLLATPYHADAAFNAGLDLLIAGVEQSLPDD